MKMFDQNNEFEERNLTIIKTNSLNDLELEQLKNENTKLKEEIIQKDLQLSQLEIHMANIKRNGYVSDLSQLQQSYSALKEKLNEKDEVILEHVVTIEN